MTDNEITEAYFVARGWELVKTIMPFYWLLPSGERIHYDPEILTDYPAFKEHCLLPMMKEGCKHTLGSDVWLWYRDEEPRIFIDEEIIDNEILKAAVIGATRYYEEIK